MTTESPLALLYSDQSVQGPELPAGGSPDSPQQKSDWGFRVWGFSGLRV